MAIEAKTSTEVMRELEERGHDPSELFHIGVRPPLRVYLNQLWQRRHFIWYDSRQRAANQNNSHIFGNLWLVLRPMLDAVFYYVIFALLLGVDRGIENFPAFLVIGLLMFRSTAGAISSGGSSMRSAKSMLRAFSFPRAAVPISNVLQSALTAVITTAAMCVAIILIPPHALPQLAWVLIVPIFVLHMFVNLGVTFITARIGWHFPDMTNLMSVISRMLMYGSGVMFPIERFVSNPDIREIVMLNPLFRIIDMSRTVLIDGAIPDLKSWLIVSAWAVVLVVGGFLFFWRGEESYGREVR